MSNSVNHIIQILQADNKNVPELLKDLAKGGLTGLTISTAYGGLGLSFSTSFSIVRKIAFEVDSTEPLFCCLAELASVGMAIQNHGTEFQKQTYLPMLCSGASIAANLITEVNAGSDVYAIKSRVIQIQGGYQLNASKTFITNGLFANLFLCYCKLEGKRDLTAVIFNSRPSDIIERSPINSFFPMHKGWAEVVIENKQLKEENILAGINSAYPVFAESMDIERLLMSAMHIGRWEKAIEISKGILRKQKAAGLDMQAWAHSITESEILLMAALSLCKEVSLEMDHGKRFTDRPGMCKYFTSNGWLELMGKINLHEYVSDDEHRILSRLFLEAQLSAIYSGANSILVNNIANKIK